MELTHRIFGPKKVLEVNRNDFTLTLLRRKWGQADFEVFKVWPIAVGMPHLETPPGTYVIHSKSRKPDYQYPYSDWVSPEWQGVYVKFGDPANPIKGRWIGVTDDKEGVGIHGTAANESIGTRASHGCIRMHVLDVVEVFDLVPRGTIIIIH